MTGIFKRSDKPYDMRMKNEISVGLGDAYLPKGALVNHNLQLKRDVGGDEGQQWEAIFDLKQHSISEDWADGYGLNFVPALDGPLAPFLRMRVSLGVGIAGDQKLDDISGSVFFYLVQ